MTTAHPMAKSILLLQTAYDQASSRARGLRTMEALNRDGTKPGDTRYRMADMRSSQAAELEVLAADYRRALRQLLHIAIGDASVYARYYRDRASKLAQTTPSADSLAKQQQLQREAAAQQRQAAEYRAAHDALYLPPGAGG